MRQQLKRFSLFFCPHLPSPQDGAGDDSTDTASSEGEQQAELEAIGMHVEAMLNQSGVRDDDLVEFAPPVFERIFSSRKLTE